MSRDAQAGYSPVTEMVELRISLEAASALEVWLNDIAATEGDHGARDIAEALSGALEDADSWS